MFLAQRHALQIVVSAMSRPDKTEARTCCRTSYVSAPTLAFRSARSRDINVLKTLQASLCHVGHTRGKLGIEATCRFLQSIGVDFDPGVLLERSHTDKSSRSWSDSPPSEELTRDCASTRKGEVSASDTPHNLQASPRPKEGPPSDQAGTPRCQSCHARGNLGESVPRPEPSRARQEHCQTDEGTQQDERNYCASCATASAPGPLENEAVEMRAFVDEAPPSRRHAGDGGSNSAPNTVAPTGGNVCVECGNRPVGSSSRSFRSAAPFDNGPRGNR